jgi:hypothetical protein
MRYTVEMGSGGMIYIPSFIKTGSGIQKLVGQDTQTQGRAIAQAVSRWLPTAAARVRARVWSCGICGRQCGAGAGFLRVLRFPLPIFIPPISPQSPSSIIWGLYNRPEVAAVPSGLSLTPSSLHRHTKKAWPSSKPTFTTYFF